MVTIVTPKTGTPAKAIFEDYATKEGIEHPVVEADPIDSPYIPGVIVPEDVMGTELSGYYTYVGYRIEKQKYDYQTRTWIFVENIYVDDLAQNEFYDTRISYSQHYRYRIFSIMKFMKGGPVKTYSPEYSDLIDPMKTLMGRLDNIRTKHKVKFYNLSERANSHLPWPKISIEDFMKK